MSVCYLEGQAEETRDRYRDGLTEEKIHRADITTKTDKKMGLEDKRQIDEDRTKER